MLLARLLIAAAIAIVLFDPQIALAQQKQATAVGAGRRGDRGPRRHRGRDRDAAAGRQRRRRRGRGRRRARRDGAVLVRHRRRRVHGDPHGRREGHDDRLAREVAGDDAAGLVLGERRAAGVQRRALQRPVRRRARAPWPAGTRRCAATAPGRWRDALQPGIRVARDGFKVDQTFVAQTEPNVDWFDDVPSTAAIYLDPDGTPRDVGSTLRNPDLARTYAQIARGGASAFYSGAIAEAIVDAAQHPPIAGDANHRWRPGLMTLRRPRAATRRPSARRRTSATAASTCGASARRRAAGRPSARRSTSSRATRTSPPTAPARCTCSSRRRASRSRTATPTWPIRTSSTSRSRACSRTASPPSAAR